MQSTLPTVQREGAGGLPAEALSKPSESASPDIAPPSPAAESVSAEASGAPDSRVWLAVAASDETPSPASAPPAADGSGAVFASVAHPAQRSASPATTLFQAV